MVNQLIHQLMRPAMVGVDLGSAAIKVVELDRAGGELLLRRCCMRALEGRAVEERLRETLKEAGVTTRRACLAIASPEVIVKPLHFPAMPRKELTGAVRLEAESATLNGHTLSEMAIDWYAAPSTQPGMIDGVLSVVPKPILAARVKSAAKAGLQPCIVDIEGLAAWNAYWMLYGSRAGSDETVLLLNVGARTTNVVIAGGPRTLFLVRDLQFGGLSATPADKTEWLAEVRDSVQYARSKSRMPSIRKVVVTGGPADAAAAVPLLTGAFEATPALWNPLRYISRDANSPKVEESLGPLLTVAIGLALRTPA